MQKRRWRIVLLAAFLATIGVLIPTFVMIWIAWKSSVQSERSYLNLFAQRVLIRGEATLAEVQQALEKLDKFPEPACSREHINAMRDITIGSLPIEEVGYFEEGRLKCNSWGLSDGQTGQVKPDVILDNGLKISSSMFPVASPETQMAAIQTGSYNALVLPERFVDVVLDPNMAVSALTKDGHLLAYKGKVIPASRAEELVRDKRNDLGEADEFHSSVTGKNLIAIAVQRRADIAERFVRQLILLMPAGACIALFMIFVIVWVSRKRLSPQAELEIAVRNREFFLEYQPIIELKTGVCVGAEALVRWRRPDGTVVRPDIFMQLSEETGLIKQITDQVVDKIIEELGPTLLSDPALHIAVNLSADDIKTGRAFEMLDRKLKTAGISPAQIWIEATERSFVDVNAARFTLSLARERGHAIAIDDFGTGFSSLSYLAQLPLDALKIDKSFVDTIGRQTATTSVILHIIEMASELDLFCVAEGIETHEQLEFLRKHNVDYGQGWLFSSSLSAEAFVSFQRKHWMMFGMAKAPLL